MEFTVANMCGFLIRSKLMTADEMKAMYQRWEKDAKGNATQLQPFLKWMVTHKYVSEYQAGLLSKGHADPNDFFLNQYRIVDRLGRGRMAGVYKAMLGSGQAVAIKVLPPSKSKNPQYLARFQREASLAVQLKHPNTVRSFQIGEMRDLHYLVMEYLEGETLDDVLGRRKRLPVHEAVRVIHQALTGLQHIHECGIVHRDLKPSNLMLVPAPGRGEPDTTLHATVKICDIGLGRQLEDDGGGAAGHELTGEGMLLGTPDYLAPEQARDAHNIDTRADIYSLGCVLYHCLTGQPPFPEKNLLQQLVRHATETARPVKEFNSQVPDGLQLVLNYMMAKQAAERYPTPERAAAALQGFLVAESPAVRPEAPPPTPKPAPPSPPVAAPRPAAAAPVAVQSPPPRPTRPASKKNIPVGQGFAPPPGQEFDVELVPAEPTGWLAWLPRGKRDWILVGLGGGVVVILGLLVWLLMSLLGGAAE